jgi:hypothetical protein
MGWREISKKRVVWGFILGAILFYIIQLPMPELYPDNTPVKPWIIITNKYLGLPLALLFWFSWVITPSTKNMRKEDSWFGIRCLLASFFFTAGLAKLIPHTIAQTISFIDPLLGYLLGWIVTIVIGFPLGSFFSYILTHPEDEETR